MKNKERCNMYLSLFFVSELKYILYKKKKGNGLEWISLK